MKSSTLIWIPSLQEYKRFSQLTNKDHIFLLKSQDDDIEFLYSLNTIISKLSHDKEILKTLNIIDKYIICLYLRILYIGSTLDIKIKCPSCGIEMVESLDLTNILVKDSNILDKIYKKTIIKDNIIINCDLPKLDREYELALHIKNKKIDLIDSKLTHEIISYISDITINGNIINLKSLDINDLLIIYENLPNHVLLETKSQFIDEIYKEINPNVIYIKCQNTSCSDIQYNMNISNVNDVIKLLFQDSLYKTFNEIYYLSKGSNLSPKYIESLSPIEKNMILDIHIDNIKSKNENSDGDNTMQIGSDMGFDSF